MIILQYHVIGFKSNEQLSKMSRKSSLTQRLCEYMVIYTGIYTTTYTIIMYMYFLEKEKQKIKPINK